MKKIINVGLVFLLVIGFVFAAVVNTNKVLAKDKELYIEVSMLGSIDYFYDHKLGMKKVGEDLGVETRYMGPADWDLNAMSTAMEQAIAMQPDGIVVVGFDSSLNPIVNKAVDMGIPVVTVDADLPDSKRLAFVGTGNKNAGYTGGQKLASLIGGKGKVAIMTKPGQSNLEERVRGYKEALSNYPDIEVVQVIDTKSDKVVAARAASLLLQKFPDLAGIACVEAAGGSGAATAVKEAGKAGEVEIVSMDRGSQILNEIKNGVISATLVQQTALMPYYAVEIMHNIANNHVPKISTNNEKAGIPGVPEVIDTGIIVVDKTNYEYFMRD